jgi:hypothetical protein
MKPDMAAYTAIPHQLQRLFLKKTTAGKTKGSGKFGKRGTAVIVHVH